MPAPTVRLGAKAIASRPAARRWGASQALMGLPAAARLAAAALAAQVASAAGELLPPRPLLHVAPCTDFLRQLAEELHGLSTDVLNRFALAADPHATSLADRFAHLAVRGVAEGLLQLVEAAQLHFCLASRCGHCTAEAEGTSARELMEEIGLSGRFAALAQQFERFAQLMDRAATEGAEEVQGQTQLSPQARLRQHRERLAVARRDSERCKGAEVALELERFFLQVDMQQELSNQALDEFFDGGTRFRGMVGKLHGVVIEAIDALPLLVLSGRAAGGEAPFASGAAIAQYFGVEGSGGSAVSWPALVELAGGRLRPGTPAARRSALCEADEWRLFGTRPLALELSRLPPYRDSSGAFSWHGAPVQALLEALARAGHESSFAYWAILPEGMVPRNVACEEAHGIIYDPTACLEEAGWGGTFYYVAPRAVGSGERRASVQTRLWAWAGERVVSEDGGESKEAVWPPEPPPEPLDVLFLHPLAGNCALLPELLGESAGGTLARLLYVPINPTMPPPLRAAPNFDQHWQWHLAWGREATEERGISIHDWAYVSMSYHYLAQCSLAQLAELLEPMGYKLLFVEHLYAVFVSAPAASALQRPEANGGGSGARAVALFEAWRSGWFCSPMARGTLMLEARAPMDIAWLGALGGFASASAGSPAQSPEQADAVAAAAVCGFLLRHGLSQDQAVLNSSCDDVYQTMPDTAQPSVVKGLHPAVAMRRRGQWALELRSPLAGLGYHLGGPLAAEELLVESQEERLFPGLCSREACECLAPHRGPRCDVEDAGGVAARARPFRAAVHYIVNDEPMHVAELMHALRNLWRRFNARFDYPVLIFHDGLSAKTRTQIAMAAPHRLWFHYLPQDFLPNATTLPPDLQQEDDMSEASHHSFSAGYRAQSRFRSGPVFAHPVVARLDYLWSLDTDSMFPEDLQEDPFEVMHRNASLVLGYRYITVTSSTSSKRFWESTLLYAGYAGVDLVRALHTKGSFLRTFLTAPDGWQESATWNYKVVMTDCELLRVSFFRPGSTYYGYFEFLDALQGFWLHRWGDHAVRGLGTALALWLQQESGPTTVLPQAVYQMKIPYAHQGSCFCANTTSQCVSLAKEASGELLWPLKKKIWECRIMPLGKAG